LLTLLLFHFQGCTSSPSADFYSVEIGGEMFSLELNLDKTTRTNGMMHRTSFTPHGGMLFVFPDASIRSFWMKNCFVDIDLIFLDSRGTITTLYQMPLEPPQGQEESDWEYESRLNHYYSNGPIRFAIELESGSIDRLRLRVNQRIPLDLPYLRSLAR
jgi:hypothetical protein